MGAAQKIHGSAPQASHMEMGTKYLIAKYFPLSQFACPSQIPNGRLNLYRVFMGESKTKAYVRRGILNAD